MTTTLIGSQAVNNATSTSTGSQTLFNEIGTSALFTQTTEARSQSPFPYAGIIAHASAYVLTNSRGSSATTMQLRKNTANGNSAVSCTASTTGYFTDATHSDSIAANDNCNWAQVTGSGSGTFQINSVTAGFTGSSVNGWLCGANSSASVVSGSTTNGAFNGPLNTSTTEANLQIPVRALTARAVYLFSNSNGTNIATTYTVRNNAGNTSVSVSVTAATTGAFIDSAHSASFANGDLVNWRAGDAGGLTGQVQAIHVGGWFEMGTQQTLFPANNGPASGQTSTFFFPVIGYWLTSTTEAQTQCPLPFAANWANVLVNMSSGLTTTGTLKSRINGADGTQSASVTSATTGTFTDSTHFDSVAAGSLINLTISGGGTLSGNLKYSSSGLSAPASFIPPGQAKKGGGAPGNSGNKGNQGKNGGLGNQILFSNPNAQLHIKRAGYNQFQPANLRHNAAIVAGSIPPIGTGHTETYPWFWFSTR